MSSNFPPEILTEILIKLPVKSLVRFTLVSKSWQALITSPNFVSKHHSNVQNQDTKNLTFFLLRHYSEDDGKEQYTLHSDNENFVSKCSEIKFLLKSRVGFFRIVGCCNGLVCLCDDLFGTFRTKPITLWNPSIQKSIVLPLPSIHPRSRDYLMGFGCELQSCDYKVVRIVYDKGESCSLELTAEAEVFSLSKKSWERVRPIGLKRCSPDSINSQAFLNGVTHWCAYDRRFGNLIMGFDFHDEEFRDILLPGDLAGQHAANLHFTVIGDRLAMIQQNDFKRSFCFWVMKEYGVVESWERLYNVELMEGMDQVIGFRKDGELLVTMYVNEQLPHDRRRGLVVSFDPKSRLNKGPGILGRLRSLYAHKYVESLVLLTDQNGAIV